MKIWFNDVGRVVIENDDEQAAMPQDIALYLMRLGTSVQRDQVKSDRLAGDFKLISALKAEAER